MQSKQLLQELSTLTRQIIAQAENLQQAKPELLSRQPGPGSWSALECLEHLNLYADFYIPQIARSIQQSNTRPEAEFNSGWLGNYFAESMMPKQQLNRMKTFANKNPLNAPLDKEVITRFIAGQHQLLQLLEQAGQVSLNKVKISTSIASFIRIRLGDTLRFVIYHNQRHLLQAQRALAAAQQH